MELYMMNRQHGRMILEFVENGPLIWPTIEENGVTRPRKYYELSVVDAIQADCDVKATNIILQGLPPVVYALVSNHQIAKELWERIQLLMQGTSLTKQERECKLYDEFDKFAYKKGKHYGRQTSLVAGTTRTYTPGVSGRNSGKQRTVICYNCKGEDHMSKQCTKPKRKRGDSWFKLMIWMHMTLIVMNSTLPKLLSWRIYSLWFRCSC
ncbi:integrase, catalytic region, zinc finger, CCHC-type containing protein [Tanacetum coccineum]